MRSNTVQSSPAASTRGRDCSTPSVMVGASVLLHWRYESYAASADDLAALVSAMLQGGLFGEDLWEPFT